MLAPTDNRGNLLVTPEVVEALTTAAELMQRNVTVSNVIIVIDYMYEITFTRNQLLHLRKKLGIRSSVAIQRYRTRELQGNGINPPKSGLQGKSELTWYLSQ